jgi:hypothetical protein
LVPDTARTRLDAVDLLRGLVMVIMAPDHVRDYFTELRFDPSDLDRTTVLLFFTRWITHFCASAFAFLPVPQPIWPARGGGPRRSWPASSPPAQAWLNYV